jgi:hypothetical protein
MEGLDRFKKKTKETFFNVLNPILNRIILESLIKKDPPPPPQTKNNDKNLHKYHKLEKVDRLKSLTV